MKNLTKILCALMVVFMISCAKDGAVGPAGANGTAGTNGTNGTNGTDGNANVDVYLWNTTPASTGTGPYITNFPLTAITADVLSKGAVLMYIENTGANDWLSIPFSNDAVYFYTLITVGNVALKSKFSPSTSNNTRIVVIGGTTSGLHVVNRTKPWTSYTETEKAQMLYPNVDFSDYNAVKSAFNLKD